MRSLRIRSRETRLAVMFATAPDSKVRRAFAMSTDGVSTGTPDRAHRRRRAADERVHEVDVVDHEVEHDRDVGPARIERRQAVALDEPRRVDVRQRGADRAIEPLDVARLHQRAVRARERQHLVGLVERRRDRLLDQRMDAAASSTCCATAKCAGVGTTIVTRVHDVEQRLERSEAP